MFLLIGGGEHAGSGADRIRAGWRSLHWRPPQIRIDDQPDRVTLTLPTINLIPDATMRRLRERFHRDFEALLPAELQALATADLEGSVSNARLQELLTGHPVDISRMLQRLCERGLLVSDNRRRWTTYRLGEVQRPLFPVAKAAGGSSPLPPSSSPLPPSSSPLEPSSSGMQPDSIGMQGSGPGPTTPSMDDELRAIAAPVAARGKAVAAVVRATILNLCSGRYLSADQLGTVLHRNPARIQARFLAPMVRDGLLALRFPEAPNRADQAYTTVRRS
jgi:ATP-dependent DNA helicase RecG